MVVQADAADAAAQADAAAHSIVLDDDDSLCAICLLVLYQPVKTSCGHYYCHSCWERLTATAQSENREPSCPTCRTVEAIGGPVRDHAREREVQTRHPVAWEERHLAADADARFRARATNAAEAAAAEVVAEAAEAEDATDDVGRVTRRMGPAFLRRHAREQCTYRTLSLLAKFELALCGLRDISPSSASAKVLPSDQRVFPSLLPSLSAALDPPTSGSSHPCCPPCLLTPRSLGSRPCVAVNDYTLLTALRLEHNSIEHLAPLSLPVLKVLSVHHNRIESLAADALLGVPVRPLPASKSVSFAVVRRRSPSLAVVLTSSRACVSRAPQALLLLDVGANRLKTLDGIGCLPALATLNAPHNALATRASIAPLAACASTLSTLELHSNAIGDAAVLEPLSSLTALRSLRLGLDLLEALGRTALLHALPQVHVLTHSE